MTHICVSILTIIGSDNGLLPGRPQAITWTNVGILLIGPLGTNISDMSIKIHIFSFKKIHLKMVSGKWRPFCLSLNVLRNHQALLWAIVDRLTSYDAIWHCKAGSTLCQVMNGSLPVRAKTLPEPMLHNFDHCHHQQKNHYYCLWDNHNVVPGNMSWLLITF